MTQANEGNRVKVHYQGLLNDGTVFDSSYESDPLEFTIGEGEIIPGFEEAVVGMQAGDKKNVAVTSEQAYGDYKEERKIEIERSQLPEDITPEIGMVLQMDTPNNRTLYVTIVDIGDENLTLDANHPLAGKDLNFEIELMEIMS
jgi:FKBP-type peptidyl-prolyl cis-trans isomerase 2